MHNIELATSTSTHADIVGRLSRASVNKHFDAYVDVPWDSDESRIDPTDPRWECAIDEPLGATEWYRSQPQPVRARIGLDITACRMKMGIEFENILSRGLLEFAGSCKNGSLDYRYAYHEVIEEGQHSLMFQEFVNRSGCNAPGLSPLMSVVARQIPRLGRVFPELFFVHVLAGEVPIDQVQRHELSLGAARHPLARRIAQIHVTEEARHVCYAHSYLASHVPALSRARRAQLRLIAPFAVGIVTDLILRLPPALFAQHRVPKHVVAEASRGPAYVAFRARAMQPLCEQLAELGIATRATAPLYRALRIWPAATVGKALSSGPTRLLSR